MVPPRNAREPSILYTQEYTEFIEKLRVYHEQRGTHFEPEPKVGAKHIDLLQLYKAVTERGGYDAVSDEKLAWRKLGQEFNLGTANLPALAFAMKTAYYKNLAAYEITTIHKKTPPPREILEDTTAKGGGLLTRTLENYRPSARRETGGLGNDGDDASGDDGTPARERNPSEEAPNSGSGRVTRGLRQAPPQRILFQPETQSSRPSRNLSSTSHAPSPQHHLNHNSQQQNQQPRGASSSYTPSANMDMSLAVATYEPRPRMPLTLQQVITPGNSPVEWARRQRVMRDAIAISTGHALQSSRDPKNRPLLPGVGFDGPNIYVRCLCSLRSGIPAEQDYALHHLVKISMERGDKYKFEGFPGLAEALVEKVLEVGSLFYDVDWQISYMEDLSKLGANMINGVDGTPDILARISSLNRRHLDDNIQTEEFSDKMLQINEAALTLRNMVMLEENAVYVSELMPLRDFLSIALNLPKMDSVVELKHYALDIAEQITKYLHFDATDPLYVSLIAQLFTDDRGAILTALRAISRISMNLEENNLLQGVPSTALQNIMDWTLLPDEDLVHACLDFFYQYTAVVSNVDYLITELQVEPLVNQLVRLLAHGARPAEKSLYRGRNYRKPAPEQIAPLPRELLQDLLRFDEPERSSQWLRCLFEEDKDESITQIALWQAYQSCFLGSTSGSPLLAAAEFIKNVSTTFAEKAAAQVQQGLVQKFIIKGIRMRSVPVDLKGEEFSMCRWRNRNGRPVPCGDFFMSPEEMYKHILRDHVSAKEVGPGQFDNSGDGRYSCFWLGCDRFHAVPATKLITLANHIKVHLPPRPTGGPKKPQEYQSNGTKMVYPSYMVVAPKVDFRWQMTAVDEHGEAAGIPLSAVLVLRNLARNLSKTEAEDAAMKVDGGVSWVDRLFKPVEPKLYEVLAHNKSLMVYMSDLLDAVKDS